MAKLNAKNLKRRATALTAAVAGMVTPVVGLGDEFDWWTLTEGQLRATMVVIPIVGLGIVGILNAILGDVVDLPEE